MFHEADTVCKKRFSLLGMNISLETNLESLLDLDEYFLGKGGGLHSLLSNFHRFDESSGTSGSSLSSARSLSSGSFESGDADLVFSMIDDPDSPLRFYRSGPGRYSIEGPLVSLETGCPDKRICMFGNMGLFSKILVGELEHHGIYSMHSTSFYDRTENRLYLVIGGSGSGKSTVLLKAISLGGIEVFGTELTHFTFVDGKLRLLKGSLWQNCRMGNLVYDFPELLARFGLEAPATDPWYSYKSVPLFDIQAAEDMLYPDSVTIVLPRIEGERFTTSIRKVPAGSLHGTLFQNLSDKVSPATLLWGKEFVPGLDTPESQTARMAAAKIFLEKAPVTECWNVLASPEHCLDGIYPRQHG